MQQLIKSLAQFPTPNGFNTIGLEMNAFNFANGTPFAINSDWRLEFAEGDPHFTGAFRVGYQDDQRYMLYNLLVADSQVIYVEPIRYQIVGQDLAHTIPPLHIMDTLGALIRSSIALNQRFNVTPMPEHARLLVNEEVTELLTAIDATNRLEEAADCFVVIMQYLLAHHATLDGLRRAALAVVAKNNAKTHLTHTINSAGKIARRSEGL